MSLLTVHLSTGGSVEIDSRFTLNQFIDDVVDCTEGGFIMPRRALEGTTAAIQKRHIVMVEPT